jgi:hypothetical protein
VIEFRKDLSAPGMVSEVNRVFGQIPDHRDHGNKNISLRSTLMSALAMFFLKSPSLLKFDERTREKVVKENLENLFFVDQVPCDTQMREILDPVPPEEIKGAFPALFAIAQRGKVLEKYGYLDGKYLMPLDGTGLFSSHEVRCENCCVKEHKNGSFTFYHQMLSAVIVHPDQKNVIPIGVEAIIKQDGTTKNDCERNAGNRLLPWIRQQHPHLNLIVVEDGLGSNAPHIRLIKSLGMSYILGAKPGDHENLFKRIEEEDKLGTVTHFEIRGKEVTHRFKFINQICLNESNPDLFVNFIEYWEIKNGKEIRHFSWVTDIEVTKDNAVLIMRGGRARWRIENETFSTLKNQGYNFEHNFGHGEKNLSTNFGLIMMLAFMIDQLQELCCKAFQAALIASHARYCLWEKMRNFVQIFVFTTWESFFSILIKPKYAIYDAPYICDSS